MLHGLIIALGLGAGWAWVRLLRGRSLAWLGLPLLGGLLAGLAWALQGGLGQPDALVPLLALGLLATGCGAGLGAAAHADWNTRRRWGLSLTLLALGLEGALLLAWLGSGHSENASPSWILLFAASGLAAVAFRAGVLPEQVRWRGGLQGAVALCAVLGVGLWWWHCETLAQDTLALLSGDLVANVSHQGAWAVGGAAAIAGVLLLGSGAQVWVRRFGAGLALGIGLLLPLPTLAMRWAVDQSCQEHLPEAQGRFDAAPPDPPIEIPEGWCRAPLTPSVACPRVPTLYERSTRGGWVARRLKRDPMDTLWRQRWSRPGSVQGQAMRRNVALPHLGSWLVSGGNREPEDLDGTLERLSGELQNCSLPSEPDYPMVLGLLVSEGGQVRSVSLQGASRLSPSAQSCVQVTAERLEFPRSTCPGDQRVLVPIYAGLEREE